MQGRLWKSVLTEPVSGSTPFENSSEVSEGSSEAHAYCRVDAHGRIPRFRGAVLRGMTDLQDWVMIPALK